MKQHHPYCTIYQNNSFSCLPKLPPGVGCFKRSCRYIRKLTLVSESHPMTKLFLRSSVKVLNEKRLHIRSKQWFVFHPFSQLVLFWTYFYGFVLTIDLILTPYLCYDNNLLKAVYKKENIPMFSIILLMNFFALMNMVIRLNTGYYIYETKHLVLKPSEIFKAYGLMSFIIDILSAQPIVSIYFYVVELKDKDEELYVRLFHIARLLPLLRKNGLKTAMHFVERCLELTIKQPTRVLIAKYVVFVIFILHWLTCSEVVILYMTTKFVQENPQYYEHMRSQTYLECILRTAETCFHLKRKLSYTLIQLEICEMLFGIFFKGYVSAVMINHFLLFCGSNGKNNDKMYQLKEYAKTNKLPPHLQVRLTTYLKNKFRHQYFDEVSILASLSDHLRMEMKMNSCNPQIEKKLFKGIPQSHIGKIVRCFRTEIYLPHDFIIKVGSQDDKTYFINNGSVFLCGIYENEICHLNAGDMFGALCLHPFESFTYSVIADTYVEVFVLSQKNFTNCILNHEKLMPRFQHLVDNFLKEYQIDVYQYLQRGRESKSTPSYDYNLIFTENKNDN